MRWGCWCKYWRGIVACLAFMLMSDVYADISGKVFRDFNSNGSFDSGVSLTETGMAGISVKAFDSTGTQVGATASSAADGSYTLTGLSAGVDYRVEFSWAETWLQSSAAGGSSVQFVKDGVTGVDFAVSDPNEYAHTHNPYLAIPQYINGNASSTGISDRPSLFVIPFNAHSPDSMTQIPQPAVKASIGQTGATWGVAYQPSHQTLYTSAVIRRFSGLGPLGIGGIYKVDMSNPTNASTGSLNYIDVKSIGIPVGDDPRDDTTCNSLATRIDQPAHDIAAAQQVGEVGIGGISMDNDHHRLWLVNMADRKLYGIQNVSPATTPTVADVLGGYSIELPSGMSCQSGILRPWAVKYHQGKVYVGALCDASSAFPGTEELAGYILGFDPTNTAAGFAVEHSFRFNTPRAGYDSNVTTVWYGWQHYPGGTPILTSIEFDLDGSLMIGVLNRAAMMSGTNNYNSLDCADTNLSDMPGAGDVLRFCKSGHTYVDGGAATCTTAIPDTVKTHDEYYWGDYGPLKDQKIAFNETAQGGLAFLSGSGQLVSNGFDPSGFHQGGLYWFNNQTGGDDNRYFIYNTQTGLPYPPETMGKSIGLGDLELLLDSAPLEIGNRVWADEDGDGIQDAGEKGLAGIPVKLFSGATELATATTGVDGSYYFTNATGASTTSKIYGISQLQPNLPYTIKFPTTTTVLGSPYKLTVATAGDNTLLDSNAPLSGDVTILPADLPTAGANNHSVDVGYSRFVVDVELSKVVDKTTAKRGETLTYTLTVVNRGVDGATGVEVLEQLPADLSYVSHHASQGNYNANSGLWTVGNLANGASASLVIAVTIQ